MLIHRWMVVMAVLTNFNLILASRKPVSPATLLRLQSFGDQMDEMGRLDYGSRCNFTDEMKRHDIAGSIPSLLAAPTEKAVRVIINEMKLFLDTGRSLCNAKMLLSCDEATELCQCGPKFRDTFYTRENGGCKWAEESQCIATTSMKGPDANAMCAKHTKCIMLYANLDCTIENLVNRYVGHGQPNCRCVNEARLYKLPNKKKPRRRPYRVNKLI